MTIRKRPFSVLVATDGSPEANAAVTQAATFPWPAGTRIHGIVAKRRLRTFQRPQYVVDAFNRACQRAARHAERILTRHRPDARVVVEDKWATDAILSRARQIRADVIVLGSRSAGMAARLRLGSVSRQVVRRATCAVLIVHGRRHDVGRVVVGVDGSTNSHRAGALLAALKAPRGTRAVVLCAVDPIRVPSMPFVPAAGRAIIARQAAALQADMVRKAKRDVVIVARMLRRAGWRAQPAVRIAHPLPELLREVERTRADLLVIGARGVGGVERLLLGSVAEGVLNRCRVPILLVR
jgi:nucleotide-binding universal stress UspA family protein